LLENYFGLANQNQQPTNQHNRPTDQPTNQHNQHNQPTKTNIKKKVPKNPPLELVRVDGREGGLDEGAEAPLGGLEKVEGKSLKIS